MKYSCIIPTFKRKDEVDELLDSFTKMEYKDFEVILADGTPDESLIPVIENYKNKLTIVHIHRPMLGISESRNLGAENAKGEYIFFFDSDCIIPSDYFNKVNNFIQKESPDAFGGPDAAAISFTPVQKAINHTMTSLLTTGGIRGRKNYAGGRFYPRSFNMGVKKNVFIDVNGFSMLKVSEDIDLSIKMYNKGYKVCIIPEAFVYHKRRTNFRQFFKQVFRFGAGRINIGSLYKGELKLTHTIPALFLIYILLIPFTLLISKDMTIIFLMFLGFYIAVLFAESLIKNRSLKVAFLTIVSLIVQFTGYGTGFILNFWKVRIRKKEPVLF